MTVAELIVKLSNMPLNAQVYFLQEDGTVVNKVELENLNKVIIANSDYY